YALQAALRRVPAVDPPVTPEEREAASIVVECVHGSSSSACSPAPGAGARGGAGGRGGPATGLPQHMNAEATILLGQKKTALEFRDFLAGEIGPPPPGRGQTYLRR